MEAQQAHSVITDGVRSAAAVGAAEAGRAARLAQLGQQPLLHDAASVIAYVAIPDGRCDGDVGITEHAALQRFFGAASHVATAAAGDALIDQWKRLHARWGKDRLRQAL
eukprot:COSAG01_NODE_37134_length_508_cov_0.633252_1_plen_108_part_10